MYRYLVIPTIYNTEWETVYAVTRNKRHWFFVIIELCKIHCLNIKWWYRIKYSIENIKINESHITTSVFTQLANNNKLCECKL